jgi:hypothetical protein
MKSLILKAEFEKMKDGEITLSVTGLRETPCATSPKREAREKWELRIGVKFLTLAITIGEYYNKVQSEKFKVQRREILKWRL